MVYLIDFENMGYEIVNELGYLTEKDLVIIIHSEVHAERLKLMLETIETKAKVKLQEVTVGYKDALDFKMITYSMLLFRNKYKELVYVSKDKGYLSVKDTIIEFGANVTITLGFTSTLKYIETLYVICGGVCKKYENRVGDFYTINEENKFENINKPIYKLLENDNYIQRHKVKEKKSVHYVEDVSKEETYEDFIKRTGLVKEENKDVLNQISKVEITNIKPKLEVEKQDIDWEKFCSSFENWSKKQGLNVQINKIIQKLQARNTNIEKEELYQVIGAITKKKKGEIKSIIDSLYKKYQK